MEKEGLAEMLLKDIEKSRFDFDTKKFGSLEVETAAVFQNYIKNFYSQEDDEYLELIRQGWCDYRAAYKGDSLKKLQKEGYYLQLSAAFRYGGIAGMLFGLLINPAFLFLGLAGIGGSFYFSSKAMKDGAKKTVEKKRDILDALDMDMFREVLLEKKEAFYPKLFSKAYKLESSDKNP